MLGPTGEVARHADQAEPAPARAGRDRQAPCRRATPASDAAGSFASRAATAGAWVQALEGAGRLLHRDRRTAVFLRANSVGGSLPTGAALRFTIPPHRAKPMSTPQHGTYASMHVKPSFPSARDWACSASLCAAPSACCAGAIHAFPRCCTINRRRHFRRGDIQARIAPQPAPVLQRRRGVPALTAPQHATHMPGSWAATMSRPLGADPGNVPLPAAPERCPFFLNWRCAVSSSGPGGWRR